MKENTIFTKFLCWAHNNKERSRDQHSDLDQMLQSNTVSDQGLHSLHA